METFRILVWHSRDRTGDDAMREALTIAEHAPGVEIDVVHVATGATAATLRAMRLDLRARLDRAFGRRADDVHVIVRGGDPCEVMDALLGERRPHLVIVGSGRCYGREPLGASVVRAMGAIVDAPVLFTYGPVPRPGGTPPLAN